MKYKVMLRGENFKVALEESVAKLGFFTTRFLEAETPDAAERTAVDLLRQDPHLQRVVRNVPTDPPMIYHESPSNRPFERAGMNPRQPGKRASAGRSTPFR